MSAGLEVLSSFGITFDPGVEFRGSVDLEPKVNTGYVDFDVWGRSTSLDFALALDCSRKFTGRAIPILGTPLSVTPKLVLTASLEGTLSLKPRFYVGFIAGRRSGGWERPPRTGARGTRASRWRRPRPPPRDRRPSS